jgi:Holliday junction resolvasome RuvABC DNA-binding subunit
MIEKIQQDLQDLTVNVEDAPSKPKLRSTLGGALHELGYDQDQIGQALDKFFKEKTVH